jgi:hypothetical protein
VPEEHAKKWLKVYEQSAKTFAETGHSEAGAELMEGASYEELLAYHKADAAKVPGWTAMPTPSKKFILKTSSTNKKFLDEVTLRLEKSRELYEADFPPPKGFDHVSIVRVCASEEQFHQYGARAAGWPGGSTRARPSSCSSTPSASTAT